MHDRLAALALAGRMAGAASQAQYHQHPENHNPTKHETNDRPTDPDSTTVTVLLSRSPALS
jgi:hypothetical protein